MKYEISNVVFNHKPSEWEIQHRNPFAPIFTMSKGNRISQTFYLMKDLPQNLLQAYKLGHSFKPHAFDESGDAFVNCIVLDFDNLTKAQFDFVREHSTYGDISSGMRTWLKENAGIPNATPPKWKYKVFYPVHDCLCTYDDVEARFKEAVAYYNPTRSEQEVEETWKAWKRANNRKDKVTDPIFNGWILPDVAMLHHFRSQITYSIVPEQVEKYKLMDDIYIFKHLPVAGMGKVTPTLNCHYKGLPWKLEEAKPELKYPEVDRNAVEECEEILKKNIHFPTDTFNLPTTKAGFARLLHTNHFDDLVLYSNDYRNLFGKVFKKLHKGIDLDINHEQMKKNAELAGKVFARIYAEIRYQGLTTSMKELALLDIVRAFKEIHGQKVFSVMKDTALKKDIVHRMATSFMGGWTRFTRWRAIQRLMRTNVGVKVLEARDKWRASHDQADRIEFLHLLNEDLKERMVEAQDPKYNQPFDYHRRGFKKEVFDILLNGEVKLSTPKEFIERLRTDIVPASDGEYSDEFLSKWYVEYKTEWNKTYPEDTIGRKTHKSKYLELFKNMDKEEAMEWIQSSDLHRQQKKRLMKMVEVFYND